MIRFIVAISLAVFLFYTPAVHGATIPGFFNTGVDSLGNLLAPGNADTHYTLVSEPAAAPTVALVSIANASYNEPNGPTSSWISPVADGSQNMPVGFYDYRSTIDLSGFNSANVVLTGQAYVDDSVSIVVNGVTQASASSFQPTLFTLSGAFVPGLNTIDYVVDNTYLSSQPGGVSPTALRIEFIAVTNAPEPALISAGVMVIAAFLSRKRR